MDTHSFPDASVPAPTPNPTPAAPETIPSKSFETVFNEFLSDPTKSRKPSAVQAYNGIALTLYQVIGRDKDIGKITREDCRKLLDTLRSLPANYIKRFPGMTAPQAAAVAKEKNLTGLLSPISINKYMTAMASIMNFAVNEGYIDRNPCRALRVIDPVKLKDKRLPYSEVQLKRIFNSPIYTSEAEAYRNTARYWVPLIGLYSGMRLNETCALDTADVILVDGVLAFKVAEGSDKSLKTEASKRIIPVHKDLLDIGFADFIAMRRNTGKRKLFPELVLDSNGSYGKEFSKWYGRYMRQIGVQKAGDKTCYHSLRHNFRDALRAARIDHEVSLALGGWTNSSKGEVHANYGKGHDIATLKLAIDRIKYKTPLSSARYSEGANVIHPLKSSAKNIE